jgi:hypothetical protein
MESKKFISGIYNYCDRWCEKCQLSQCCKLYADEQEELKSINTTNDFKEILANNFLRTMKLLQDFATQRGIDLGEMLREEDAAYEKITSFKLIKKQPEVDASIRYSKKIEQFLKKNNDFENEKTVFIKQIEMGIEVEKNEKTLNILREALQIINWYQFQISVKLTSAFRYFPHEPNFEDEIQNMYHASTKIALIGIENSIKA